MRKIVFAVLLAAAINASAQSPTNLVKFDFRSINVAQVVQLIYSEAIRDAYVIDPEVLNDNRLVSFRYDSTKGDIRVFIDSFFDSIGLAITRRSDVDYITLKREQEKIEEEADVFVYRPRFRDGSYLADIIGPLFQGAFTAKRGIKAAANDRAPQKAAPAGSAADAIDRKSDLLVFSGTAAEIERLKKIIAQVDKEVGDVMVRGVLYEVQTSRSDGSAFGLALNLIGGKVGISLGRSLNAIDNFVTFKNSAIDVVLSALSDDSRFKVVSAPTLRVASGGNGRFTVGQEVPVLGSVTFPGNGVAPVRSVEYRSSGVIFDLQPVVHDDAVDLTVMQQVSNFVLTDTGVNDSPTLIKRELTTSLTVTDGEVIVIGGLAENKESDTKNGLHFIPDFFHTKKSSKSNSEILLVLQLNKI